MATQSDKSPITIAVLAILEREIGAAGANSISKGKVIQMEADKGGRVPAANSC